MFFSAFFITFLSVHPKIQEKNPKSGLLQSAIVTIYSTYLVYSAIISEPDDMHCTTISLDPDSPTTVIMLIIGVFFTFVAVIYAALSTSSSSQTTERTGLIKEEKEDKDKDDKDLESSTGQGISEDNPVAYNYSFFHVSLALAIMYLCMVITNWTLVNEGTNTFNVVPSVSPAWVKISSSWLTLILYIWTLIAPLILKNRSFNRE